MQSQNERGIALITTMLIMMLMSALLIGFSAAVTSDQRYRLIDRDRVNAFYAAQSGLEKLNAELSLLFFENVAPTDEQVEALADDPPDISDVTFTSSGAGAYGIEKLESLDPSTISTGPYAGLVALKTIYELNATARTTGGGEVHLTRKVETVAIPVFQFGMFSEVDLSFHAGPNFSFGGRVHTNGNLFLTHGDNNTLTLPEKVTAVGEIVRQQLANGSTIAAANQEGTIRMARAPGSYRDLEPEEGSVEDGPDSDENPDWSNISLSEYNAYIRDGTTGAERLELPLTLDDIGGSNADLVLRPVPGEDASNPVLLAERLFTKASLRILLSDTAEDITGLPGLSDGDPIALAGDWTTTPPAGYGPVSATNPPIALSPAPVTWGTVSGAVTAGNNRTITLSTAMPAAWQPPQIQIDINGVDWDPINCTGRASNGTQFTGCRTTGSFVRVVRNNDDVRLGTGPTLTEVDIGSNITVQNSSHATGTTITVDSTAAFFTTPISFWANGELTTCNGQNVTQLLDCDNVATLATGNTLTNGFVSDGDVAVIGGFIKIELQNEEEEWEDVTLEILNHGIAGPNLLEGTLGVQCDDPDPNAIIRLQRLRDNTQTSGACSYEDSQDPTDYWPNALFDTREGLQRDTAPTVTTLPLGGVMHYVTLDVANLKEWFEGTGVYMGGSGPDALTDNGGYSVYFSDRRSNRDAGDDETGEYGFEDVINPADTGVPNGDLDGGEDVNEDGVLQVYGGVPSFDGASGAAAPGAADPFDADAAPTTFVSRNAAQTSRAILFRRALKLVNGGLGNVPLPGFTVVSENPVYVQGDWNASQAGFVETNSATAIIADAVTVLSNNWSDNNSFSSPYATGGRARSTQSYYRFAVIAGKNRAFTRPTVGGPPQDFGTDGGAHNFLRMLESGGTVNYRGSIATFYYSRQATGVYKCCTTVYGAPTRNFAFDSDFLEPANLPPLTPMFRDINALGFTQETRPGR